MSDQANGDTSRQDLFPYLQFYPADFFGSDRIRALDHWQRSVWVEVWARCCRSYRPGYPMVSSSAPITDKLWPKLLGISAKRWRSCKRLFLAMEWVEERTPEWANGAAVLYFPKWRKGVPEYVVKRYVRDGIIDKSAWQKRDRDRYEKGHEKGNETGSGNGTKKGTRYSSQRSALSNKTPLPPEGAGAGVDELVARIGDAYREVADAALPTTWQRRIQREAANGNRDLLSRIDAPALRRSRKFQDDRQLRCWGIGTVLLMLQEEAVQAHAKRLRDRQNRQAKAQSDAEGDARERALESHWQQLTEAQREPYRQQAAQDKRAQGRPFLVEALAIGLAWDQREGTES